MSDEQAKEVKEVMDAESLPSKGKNNLRRLAYEIIDEVNKAYHDNLPSPLTLSNTPSQLPILFHPLNNPSPLPYQLPLLTHPDNPLIVATHPPSQFSLLTHLLNPLSINLPPPPPPQSPATSHRASHARCHC